LGSTRGSGQWSVARAVDCHDQRAAFHRRRARHRLDCWLGPAVGQAEGEAAERRVGFERNTGLLEEGVEGSVTRRRIALLEVDLDLDRILIVGISEAAERLLGLARIPIAQDDQASRPDCTRRCMTWLWRAAPEAQVERKHIVGSLARTKP
jgi:hypothetical protein